MTSALAKIPVVILAGGRGARFDHESQVKPKPMIEVAGKPIIEHIIDGLRSQGLSHFIIAAGYLGDCIVDHFKAHASYSVETVGDDGWSFRGPDSSLVWIVDTGVDSHTGERLYRLRHLLNRKFILTYGDGLCDVDISKLMAHHEEMRATATITAVRPPGRFGVIDFHLDGSHAMLIEKPDAGWINGGFMVCDIGFIECLGPTHADPNKFTELESGALAALGVLDELCAYKHRGYWRCMDTRRDLEQIEADVAANGGKLPWRRD